ncbi:class I SAM-dependent methyltransferase [Alkalihalobacillus trypoxylicola]|uniref:Protein-L-IsoD(D-D) O-methyltransferase n=1 Tax=Alkalihalobacillus trypoxylicola TaxID=519424 RepID=A0A161PKY8_9BACI|nr:class I SAM-dependent methyltransferase [Alkalihalobacillus trypoxylicola]KYG34976.1 hypothetical protein AZF04_01185 [Alkalihalobacillus trypoxylicola]
MHVTTVRKNSQKLEPLAKEIANAFESPYIERKSESLQSLVDRLKDDILVVGKNKHTYYPQGSNQPFFYHPNSALIRIKQIENNQREPLKEMTGLQKGMSFLDCTLGLAADSLVAQYLVGHEGKVVGVEANEMIAFIVKQGLQTWNDARSDLLELMKNIKVHHEHHLSFLKKQPSRSFDIVYFDPMFEQSIDESTGIKGLKEIALYEDLLIESFQEAQRVAKHRIVLKDHWKSSRFERFGLKVVKRQHAAFHYGYYDINEDMLEKNRL